jgi:hypothetical protein
MKRALKPASAWYLVSFIFIIALTSCSLNLPQVTGDGEEANVPDSELPQPNPELSPDQVVRIQVEALQNNDSEDRGIEITFRFASPANKQFTGPIGRFKRMVKNPAYRPMLNHKAAEYDPIEISGETATQRVTIIDTNGNATVFRFALSKQSGAPCDGCWMTDSVETMPVKRQNLQGA